MTNTQLKRHGLSKSRLLLHRQCPKRLWLKVYRPEFELVEEGNEARFATGTYVGEIARQLYPDGVLIEGDDLRQAILDTQAMLTGDKCPIFEATFQADGLLIRADLLTHSENAYRMVEVKSSTSVKDYHLTDAAIQSWVAEQANLPLASVEIAHIDNTFVYPGGGDYRGLFHFADITGGIADLKTEVPAWINAARETLSGDEPNISPGAQCNNPFDCPFFGYCSPSVETEDTFPPEILPRGGNLAATLRAEGYTDLRDVPEIRLENWKHKRVWQATKSGQAILNPEAGKLLAALPYPRYYLDFETINPAVPVWDGTRPYMQVPFQWSCHIEMANGHGKFAAPDNETHHARFPHPNPLPQAVEGTNESLREFHVKCVMTHRAYLAEGQHDPRRPFAESLIDAVGTDGPIFVYNAPFERSRMQELADCYPDLAPALNAAIERIVDLLPIARDHYYHPAMRGSWSIKQVLPTIAPDLAYDDLEVANGGMAQEAFAEIMEPETLPERRRQLHEALLSYCERDTLAMVRIAHYFENGAVP